MLGMAISWFDVDVHYRCPILTLELDSRVWNSTNRSLPEFKVFLGKAMNGWQNEAFVNPIICNPDIGFKFNHPHHSIRFILSTQYSLPPTQPNPHLTHPPPQIKIKAATEKQPSTAMQLDRTAGFAWAKLINARPFITRKGLLSTPAPGSSGNWLGSGLSCLEEENLHRHSDVWAWEGIKRGDRRVTNDECFQLARCVLFSSQFCL